MKTKIVKVNEVKIESLIKKNFSEEFMRKVYDIYSNDYISIVEKTIRFDKLFTEEFGHRKDYCFFNYTHTIVHIYVIYFFHKFF